MSGGVKPKSTIKPIPTQSILFSRFMWMTHRKPTLNYTFGNTAKRSAWEASIGRYVFNLVAYKLSQETSASKLLDPFYVPDYDALLFYFACAHLLSATTKISEAGKHLGLTAELIAELFRRLKQEGLRRDGPNGLCTFGNNIVLPALRALIGDVPTPPGYRYDRTRLILVPDPEYGQRSSFPHNLVRYRRKQGLIRLWGLVARLESDHIVGEPGSMSLLFHQAPMLLRALEDPVQRGVWETLWASVLQCEEDLEGSRGWQLKGWGRSRTP
ncbi:hypothetical protein B0H16DRAFT_1763726 [Mycena metata]|uniref:Uncharacterized protein n=1 Tax=Mycena metata TaxID=1033252 RepID=A0AAD7JXP6_9AGAR|nr:hypothetical protein B0H16DRAFT_1763726 [Mycena metata]